MSISRSRLAAFAAVVLLGGCVQHQPRVVTVEASAAAFPDFPTGPLAFDAALHLLIERNPELRATRARIDAVNVHPGPEALGVSQQVLDGQATELLLRTDILALLGLGPRKAETAWARAVRDERVRQHHQRARELVADLAVAFAVEDALGALAAPKLDLDVAAFERAGLASNSVISAAKAVLAEADAERRVTTARRADARREIARLIGADPRAKVEPTGPRTYRSEIDAPDRRQLVLTRGDLQALMGAWHTADKRYRFEVARQLPNLVIGLGQNLRLDAPMQLLSVELPLDAPARAKAAACARRVAFHELQAGILNALHEADAALYELEASTARLEAATARARAAEDLLTAEQARLQTSPAALGALVFVAGRRVAASRQVREASVALARAHVNAARAAGWPSPELVGDAR